MAYVMEKFMKEMNRYIEEHKDEVKSEDDYQKLADEFIKKYNSSTHNDTADDFLEKAQNAETLKERIEYLRKAISLDPDNVDAAAQLIIMANKDVPDECLSRIEKLISKETERLREKGFFDKIDGSFWAQIETRPYMRLRETHMDMLIDYGMMSLAVKEGEEMMKLCKDDNLGIRGPLMHLYAYREDEKKALSLNRKSKIDKTEHMLALSVLYYKRQDYEKAEEYLQRLKKTTSGTKKFIRCMVNGEGFEEIYENMDSHGYRPFTEEELAVTVSENSFLYRTVPNFFQWAYKVLNRKKA